MKNLKICKKVLALTTAVGITLLSGCSGKNETKTSEEKSVCHHLIVEFGGQPVIFKECEGYDIAVAYSPTAMFYEIRKDGNVLIDARSKDGNYYIANHNDINEIEEMAIEKGAYTYKLN